MVGKDFSHGDGSSSSWMWLLVRSAGINGDRINGLVHLLMNWGYNPFTDHPSW